MTHTGRMPQSTEHVSTVTFTLEDLNGAAFSLPFDSKVTSTPLLPAILLHFKFLFLMLSLSVFSSSFFFSLHVQAKFKIDPTRWSRIPCLLSHKYGRTVL